MICQRLKELGAKVTPQYIVVRDARLSRNFQAHPPETNTKVLTHLRTPELDQFMSKISYGDLHNWIVKEVEQFIFEFEKEKEETEEEKLSDRNKVMLQTHTLLLDVIAGEKFLFHNTERRVSVWSVKTWLDVFPLGFRTKLQQEAPFGLQTFDPTKGTQVYWNGPFESHQVVYCNTYRPPLWYDKDLDPAWARTQEEKYPDLFQFFLETLFVYPAEREIFLDWLALAVFDRPHSLLSLRGHRGNGKTIFKYILFHLIGNAVESQQTVMGDFNAELRNKRVLGIDDNSEIGTRKGHTLRKRLTNPIITINEKHKQTHESEKLWASIIICSNSEDEFYVEYDERKIVSCWLTPTKMEAWPRITEAIFDWLRPFSIPLSKFDTDTLSQSHIQFLRDIGIALFIRKIRRNPSPALEYKSGHFWSDVIASLPAFKRFVVDACMNNSKDLDYDTLKADFEFAGGRHILSWVKLKNWLQSSFNIAGQPIAISVDAKEKTIKPNPQFRGML